MSDNSITSLDNSNREHEREAVIADYIRACEAGNPPNQREILHAHPELATELQQFFCQRDRMNQLVEPIRDFADDLFRAVGPGQQISYVGNYELIEEIARGGMGVVYKARQVTLGRIVAVKMIIAGQLASDDDVKRFQIEAQAAAALQHSNIVSIHEVGLHEGWHYFSMDFVSGRDLSAVLRENLLPARQAATYVAQMAEAIHYAHQQGTLHRDLKPSNILIDDLDQVRITDFGLAMRVEGNSDLTRTGQIVGTPSYMPPEQAQGKRSLIGPASDVYAMGAVLYECLTGRPPFRAGSVVETIQQVIHTEAVSLRLLNPDIPRDLETICLKCLQKEPHRRYGTAQFLADDLGRFLLGKPILARPISPPARVWRWCHRKPIIASLTALLLVALAAVTMTASLAYLQELAHGREIEKKNIEISEALNEESKAKGDATRRLYGSLVAQARANRLSRRIGQRFQSLDVLLEASRMAHAMSLPEKDFVELRTEAIACFTLADVRTAKQWNGWPEGSLQIDFDGGLNRYSRVDRAGNISVRRVGDDTQLWSLPGLGPEESWPTLSPDGKFLIVWNQRFKLWSLEGETPVLLIEGSGYSPAFRPDGRQIAMQSPEGIITLFDLPSGKQVKEFSVDREPRKLAFHPTLLQLAYSSLTGIRILDVETGDVLAHLPQAGAKNLAWHPDGKKLAIAADDFNIYIWDVASGKATFELNTNTEEASFTFSKSGDLLASSGCFGVLKLWNPQAGELLFQTPVVISSSLHIGADEKQLAVAYTDDGKLRMLEIAIPQSCYRTLIRDPVLGVGTYFSSSISPNGRILAAATADGIAIWDLVSFRRITFLPTSGVIHTVRFEESGALLAAGQIGLARWTLDTSDPGTIQIGPQQQLTSGGIGAMGTSRDGRIVAQAMRWDGGLLWNRDSLEPPIQLIHKDARFVDVSANGRWVATGSHFHTKVKIWDSSTGKVARELPIEGSSRVWFSSDSNRLVTSFGGNRQWSVETGEDLGFIGGQPAVAFSPDDKVLAVEAGDGVIRLVNPVTGLDYARLEDPHQDRAFHLSFSADGSQLSVTAQDAHSIHVWDLRAIRAELDKMGLDWVLPPYPRSTLTEPLTYTPAASSILTQPLPDLASPLVVNQPPTDELPNSSSETANWIRASLHDKAPQKRRYAVSILCGRFGESMVLETLETCLKDSDAGVRRAAAYSLGMNDTCAETAIPALIVALRDPNAMVTRAAAVALIKVGTESDAVIAGFIALGHDGNREQRICALESLGQIGSAAFAGLQEVRAALAEKDPGMTIVARKALRQINAKFAEKVYGPPFDSVTASRQDRETLNVGPGDWPQWGGSRSRNNTPTGRNIPTDWDIATGRNIKWAAKLGSVTYGNPAVANGKVFIGSNNINGYLKRYPPSTDLGVMLCFEEMTGKFLWQYSSPKLRTGRVHDWPFQGMPSTPVVDGDRLWAVTNRCEVICLDTEGFHDGENDGPARDEANENRDEADVVWRFNMMSELGVSPHNMSNCSMLIVDSALFVCTSNGADESHVNIPAPEAPSFLALDRDSGQVLWTDNSPGVNILHGQWASPAYGVFDGQPQVIFPGGDGWVYSFDPKGNGLGGSRLLWKFDANLKESAHRLGGRGTRNSIIAFPVIYDGLIYITVGDDPEHGEGLGHLWCIDPSQHIDGEDVSDVLAVDAAGGAIPQRHSQAIDVTRGERTVANPNSAVCWHYSSQDRNADGKIAFEEQFHRSLGTPAIKDDILYVADYSGLVHCLDAKSGVVYWTFDLLAAVYGSALIVDDNVFICDEDGDVAIFRHSADPATDPFNGTPLAEIHMVDSIYSTPIVANNVLYVTTKNTLYAIETGASPVAAEGESKPKQGGLMLAPTGDEFKEFKKLHGAEPASSSVEDTSKLGERPQTEKPVATPSPLMKNSIDMELVLIPPGRFQMGKASEFRPGAIFNVTLSNEFYLGTTEVTQRQWKSVMETMPWKGKENVREGGDFPATYVSWSDANDFCVKLSEQENVIYRLPTEAEWEYACRAGTTTRYCFGDDTADLSQHAWWGGTSPLGNIGSEEYPHVVATKPANKFGLFDMHGNVWEWCQDVYQQQLPGGLDPLVFDGGKNRVFRGGSWESEAIKCGSAARFVNLPWGPKRDLGFRVARAKDVTAGYRKQPSPIRSLKEPFHNKLTMAVFSPDGEIVISTSEEGTAVLWQWRERKVLHILKGHTNGVLCAAFSPDGRTVVTGGRDSKMILWDVNTGAQRAIIADHTAAVNAVLYSPDGTTIFTGSSDTTITVRDSDGKLRFSLVRHQQDVIALAITDDGKLLVSAGGNWTTPARQGEIKVWDLETRSVGWSAIGEFGGIWGIAISPDGMELAGASLDGTVRVWDLASGQSKSVLRGHTDRVIWVGYEPGSQLLTSAGLDGRMYFWDELNMKGSLISQWNNHHPQRFSFSAREMLMATAGADGTVTIWQLPVQVKTLPPSPEKPDESR